MKYAICLLVAIVGAQAVTLEETNLQWNQFKTKYQKAYFGAQESLRYSAFQTNLAKIEEHNQKYENGEVSWKMGVTKFADLTEAEFSQYVNKHVYKKRTTTVGTFKVDPTVAADDSVDWRDENILTTPKDQGNCGSCWAFSATGSIESQNALKTGNLISLSEQQLVDCSKDYDNDGCDGGLMDNAFDYIKANGIELESDYPYKGNDGTCKANNQSALTITGYVDIPPKNESALQAAVQQVGPISVAIDASLLLQLYMGGILDDFLCSDSDDSLNHGVLAVGYGEDSGTKYWIIKNSWGAGWGEQGYFRLARSNANPCGITDDASYPLL